MGGRDDGTERRADGARLTRRGLAALGVGLGAVLAGCADDGSDGLPGGADAPPPPEATKLPGSDVMSPTRIAYGEDPSQWGDLYRPAPGSDPGSTPDGAPSKGVVVVVHGGFWKAEYDASLGAPLALSLAENGWTALNLEYRRVGSGDGGGGGYPATFDDVAAGIDLLADVEELTDAERAIVVTLGHSAGGHLAVWAAARGRFERWSPVRVPVTAAVSQAGVLDLTAGLADANAAPNVRALMGGDAEADPAAYDAADPARHLPLGVPVRCVHGNADTIVPLRQSRDYVAAATAVGDDATLTEVDGDHFIVIDPATEAWERTLELLESLRA